MKSFLTRTTCFAPCPTRRRYARALDWQVKVTRRCLLVAEAPA